ncbi:protein translocase subunit SecF [Mobilicoccus pelagius]|uniref:Protein-export membrane protein SecF n=1 Tax=Mobilicoccus pelagius NBRC 104925 TaxID=1089455 RepID=H5UPF5_9MICO|nr:protein translocase subunit SecF [Mobilicoccus pelagius]GAB47613.1 protein-export membrane protein SecF [Mobilicoccus pelagius NBRC 104925]
MSRFSRWGNDLYTGHRSIDFIGRRKFFYLASAVLLLLTLLGLWARGGINLGIEFTGGSDFRVPGVTSFENFEQRATKVVSDVGHVESSKVTKVGSDTVRVETQRFDDRRAIDVRDALGKEFGVSGDAVTSSVIGPSWGESVTKDALRALALFLLLVSVVLAVYFRTWKMAVAALAALLHDILFTVGIYALAGFEVTPASAIGFLTILGYSIYDTVVVFDKVRENTNEAFRRGTMTFSEAVGLAVNQTLVRSINTSMVALLPVGIILAMSWAAIGPGTLRDLSLALFIGIAVGTYSSIFLAPPILVDLRSREKNVVTLRDRVLKARARTGESYEEAVAETQPTAGSDHDAVHTHGAPGTSGAVAVATTRVGVTTDDLDGGVTTTGRPLHPYAQRAAREESRRDARRRRKTQGEK